MRGSVQRSTKTSREAHTSQKRALLPRISLLTAVLLVVAILVAAAGGAALAALFSGNAPANLPTEVSGIGAPSDSSPEDGFARGDKRPSASLPRGGGDTLHATHDPPPRGGGVNGGGDTPRDRP